MTNEKDRDAWLTAELAASRPHLLSVAYRMLSSRAEAEDAVQEAWLRVQRADMLSLENPRGWLTTVVARVCLDMLRARKARRERADDDLETQLAESGGPDQRALLADSVGVALMVLLETLNPNERLAFVLHDLFDLPFEEIADVLSSTPAAARQLASRARRRVRGASEPGEERDFERQREVVQAFLVAARTGDLPAGDVLDHQPGSAAGHLRLEDLLVAAVAICIDGGDHILHRLGRRKVDGNGARRAAHQPIDAQ